MSDAAETPHDPAQFDPAQFDPAQFDPAQFDPAQFDPAQIDPDLIERDLRDVEIALAALDDGTYWTDDAVPDSPEPAMETGV